MLPEAMQRWLYKVLVFIAIATALSGLVLIFASPSILRLLQAAHDKTSAYFFAVVGMFMFLFGGLLYRSLKKSLVEPIFWCTLQKLGAAVAIGLGVYNAVFSPLAIGVAVFDLLSGILLLVYLKNLKGTAA